MTDTDFQKKKKEAKAFGEYAEEQAAKEYIRRGYTVVERQWRLGKTEIDIILLKDSTLVIAEVKARASDRDDALDAVSVDKRKRMIKAADAYMRRLPGDLTYRFDIVACSGTPQDFRMEIYEDAFLASDIF